MPNPVILKLEHGAKLSDQDRQAIERAIITVRHVGARENLIEEGDRPDDVHAVLEGFACRYKVLPNGERQIMAFLVPGDWCDLHVAILGEMDHAIGTLAPCKIAYIPREAVEELTSRHPAINRALWWATLVDEGTLREWLVNMGRRPADRQMAHLFCELFMRLESVGMTNGTSFDFPLTQAELADTLGISTVHVNRILQQLRADGLIELKGRTLSILNVQRLSEFADRPELPSSEKLPQQSRRRRQRGGARAGVNSPVEPSGTWP